jgi:hypothetical protein
VSERKAQTEEDLASVVAFNELREAIAADIRKGAENVIHFLPTTAHATVVRMILAARVEGRRDAAALAKLRREQCYRINGTAPTQLADDLRDALLAVESLAEPKEPT